MMKFLRAKLHGIRVTHADLNYHGSITLDPEHCARAGIVPLEYVEIWNKSNGARLTTYVIHGEPGARCCVLNGAAARLCQVGDELIVAASHWGTRETLLETRPVILTFLPDNRVDQVLQYQVSAGPHGRLDFTIVDPERHTAESCHTYPNVDVTRIRHDLSAKGWSDDEIDAFCRNHFSV